MSTDKPTPTRPTNVKQFQPKKSETLEVRIPYETKQDFLTACREDGTTASEVVRSSIHAYLDERVRPPQPEKRTLAMHIPQPIRRYGLRAAAGGIAAIGLTTFAVLPSVAAPDFKTQFKLLDKNGDGVISADEFAGPKGDDGDNDIVIETRHITHTGKGDGKGDAPPKVTITATPGVKQDAYAFYLPDGLVPDGAEQHHEYKFISKSTTKTITSDKPGDKPDADVAPPSTVTISVDDIRQKEFEAFDTDHDGKVSLAEFQARQRAMLTRGFEILDANHDKSLSQDEYARIVAPPMISFNTDGPTPPEPPKVIITGDGAGISPEKLKAAFAAQDTNKDGKLSLEEYLPKD